MKNCKCGKTCADNARSCPNCGYRFTSLLAKFITFLFALAGIFIIIAVVIPKSESPQSAASVTNSIDDADLLLSRCGAPSSDVSSENENPRPIIPTRFIEYKKQGIRVLFIPDGQLGDHPPYKWKLTGMTNLKAQVLTAKETLRRLPCWQRK